MQVLTNFLSLKQGGEQATSDLPETEPAAEIGFAEVFDESTVPVAQEGDVEQAVDPTLPVRVSFDGTLSSLTEAFKRVDSASVPTPSVEAALETLPLDEFARETESLQSDVAAAPLAAIPNDIEFLDHETEQTLSEVPDSGLSSVVPNVEMPSIKETDVWETDVDEVVATSDVVDLDQTQSVPVPVAPQIKDATENKGASELQPVPAAVNSTEVQSKANQGLPLQTNPIGRFENSRGIQRESVPVQNGQSGIPQPHRGIEIAPATTTDRVSTPLEPSPAVVSNQVVLTKSDVSTKTELSPIRAERQNVAPADVPLPRAPSIATPNPSYGDSLVQTVTAKPDVAAFQDLSSLVKAQDIQPARTAQVAPVLPETLRPDTLISRVTAGFEATISRGSQGAFELKLQPAELGTVRVILSPSETGMTAVVSADRSEILELLRRNSETLLSELRDVNSGDVNLAFNEHSDRDPQSQDELNFFEAETEFSFDVSSNERTGLANGLDIRL